MLQLQRTSKPLQWGVKQTSRHVMLYCQCSGLARKRFTALVGMLDGGASVE